MGEEDYLTYFDQEKSLLDASSGFPQYYCSDEWTLPHFDTRHRFEFDENMNVCVPASTSMSLENLVQDAVKLIHPYDEFSVSLFNEWFPSIFQLEEDYLTYFDSQVQAVEGISSDQEKSLLDASSGFPQYYCSDEWTL